ncbi:hypothetical protein K469DRAFT_681870 [Zopfia rhizophila CBS 207.26]|uniref:Uncharacterized protein n=1 Tax=Zopfia rhizophila CBS 207.26 TaxID=1314779 RepID=A0A6A6EX29_9PEZI|nr:hypothetical protein K469DRAFT_681870 [Zopfia rhizophila CBS 207.26]
MNVPDSPASIPQGSTGAHAGSVVPLSILLSCRAANLEMRDLLAQKPPNQKVQIMCGNVKGLEEVNIQLELLYLTLHDDIAQRQQEGSEGNTKGAPRSETKIVPSKLSPDPVPGPDDFVFKTIHRLQCDATVEIRIFVHTYFSQGGGSSLFRWMREIPG